MEPINKRELYLSYRRFIIHFALLLLFTLVSLFFFDRASDKEYVILAKRNDQIEQLISTRVEINRNFQLINRRFTELGEINSGQADQLAKQRILQNDIASSVGTITRLMDKIGKIEGRPSVDLYKRLNEDVNRLSRLQDSLYTTKNVIENRHMQLSNCLESNKKAGDILRRGSLRNY